MLLLFLLLLNLTTHGVNLFGFPYWENDEGIYVTQAWSSPYTYWYDHAPAGWIFLGLWQRTTGLFSFGPAVNSGRVFILILHLSSSALLYYIAQKTSGSRLAAFLTLLPFSLSPLAIYFQRRVLLDNIAVFWILLAVTLLIRQSRLHLWPTLISAITFAIAVLTKEVAIFFLPGFIYLLWSKSSSNRPFVLCLWLALAGIAISFYPLSATLKGELLPSPHRVSLIGTLGEQLSRGQSALFWQKGSGFYDNWHRWLDKDSLFPPAAAASFIFAAILALAFPAIRPAAIFASGFVFFLLTSKLVIDFYLLPLIPFICWCFGHVSFILFSRLPRPLSVLCPAGLANLVVLVYLFQPAHYLYRTETAPQIQAINFIKDHIAKDKFIVAEAWAYLDLKAAGFSSIHWSWKVEKDPAVRQTFLASDWRRINYLLVSHETIRQISTYGADFLQSALDHSTALVSWTNHSTAFLDLPKYISTNGDWAALYQVDSLAQTVLNSSWSYYKRRFLHSYGQVIDPYRHHTTSEGQAYALLRAAWQNDATAFAGIWSWTAHHLQFRQHDKLFSWLWKDNHVADSATASDADIDTATALIFASRRFSHPPYLAAAIAIIKDIWDREVQNVSGRYILTSGSDAKSNRHLILNPSYFSPAAYRLFAQVDPSHPWIQLAEDSYSLLALLPNPPPNWILIDSATGRLSPADSLRDSASLYGFDAFRTYWRVALDLLWFDTPAAKNYLVSSSHFFISRWQNLSAAYDLSGQPAANYPSLAAFTAPLSIFTFTHPHLADLLFARHFQKMPPSDLVGYWGDSTNYYDQNWVWFAYALHHRLLPNLWTPSPQPSIGI